jgi:hypothetical protein
MGGCVSPTLADIFLSFQETRCLENCPLQFKHVLYRRYVDDTFLLFRSESHVNQLVNYLNSQHLSISFTHEVEHNSCLSFLDVNVEKLENSFSTGVFRKPTFTGLGLKFDSAVSLSYKIGLISCLFHRAYKICSSYLSLTTELEFLERFFSRNGYPHNLVCNILRKKVNSLYNKLPVISSVPRKKLYFCFPYIGFRTNSLIKKQWADVIRNYYPYLDVKIIFRYRFNIGSFFWVRDRVPLRMLSNVVYLYQCSQCEATYCGETSRHLHTRIAEHKGVSPALADPSQLGSRVTSEITPTAVTARCMKQIPKC